MTKCSFITVVGSPNAGKSTLVNALVGTKVSIVTHKPQTTRFNIRGVMVEDDTQLVFIDTPGIFSAKEKYDKAMVSGAWDSLQEADHIVLMIDVAKGLVAMHEKIFSKLEKSKRTATVVLNKIDLIKKEELLPLSEKLSALPGVGEIFMISASKEKGFDALKKHLLDQAPEGAWMYPEDQISDISERLMAAEVTREKLFLQIHQEIPYNLLVETESWETKDDASVKICQNIYVSRKSHKSIVIGNSGNNIKRIGTIARK